MTAIEPHADGHWLSIEPVGLSARSRGRERTIARLGQAVAILAALAAVVVAVMQVTSTRSTTPAPAVSAVAVSPPSMPVPPPDLAASFERWGTEYDVPITLLEAVTWHESRWRADAVSEAGAIGVGQLMPATAAGLEASIGSDLDPWHADDNVRMAAHLLGTLLISSKQDVRVALAGYAQGAGSVARDGMTATTRQYVDEMIVLYDQFRAARRAKT